MKMKILNIIPKGYGTYGLSVLACVLALLLQADSQEIVSLAPMLKLIFTFTLTLMLPLIPVFLRRAIESINTKKK